MKFYLMKRQMVPDGAIVRLDGPRRYELQSGLPMTERFLGTIYLKLDRELRLGPLPTFFTDPAVVCRKQFFDDLREVGVDNFEVYPAIIKDKVDGRIIEGYHLVNIIGLVSSANMENSEYERLGDDDDDDLVVIDTLVLDSKKILPLDLFLVAEDTSCIVVSEKVYLHLSAKGYSDIYFEELAMV